MGYLTAEHQLFRICFNKGSQHSHIFSYITLIIQAGEL